MRALLLLQFSLLVLFVSARTLDEIELNEDPHDDPFDLLTSTVTTTTPTTTPATTTTTTTSLPTDPPLETLNCTESGRCGCYKGNCWSYIDEKQMPRTGWWCFTQREGIRGRHKAWAKCTESDQCSWTMTCGDCLTYVGKRTGIKTEKILCWQRTPLLLLLLLLRLKINIQMFVAPALIVERFSRVHCCSPVTLRRSVFRVDREQTFDSLDALQSFENKLSEWNDGILRQRVESLLDEHHQQCHRAGDLCLGPSVSDDLFGVHSDRHSLLSPFSLSVFPAGTPSQLLHVSRKFSADLLCIDELSFSLVSQYVDLLFDLLVRQRSDLSDGILSHVVRPISAAVSLLLGQCSVHLHRHVDQSRLRQCGTELLHLSEECSVDLASTSDSHRLFDALFLSSGDCFGLRSSMWIRSLFALPHAKMASDDSLVALHVRPSRISDVHINVGADRSPLPPTPSSRSPAGETSLLPDCHSNESLRHLVVSLLLSTGLLQSHFASAFESFLSLDPVGDDDSQHSRRSILSDLDLSADVQFPPTNETIPPAKTNAPSDSLLHYHRSRDVVIVFAFHWLAATSSSLSEGEINLSEQIIVDIKSLSFIALTRSAKSCFDFAEDRLSWRQSQFHWSSRANVRQARLPIVIRTQRASVTDCRKCWLPFGHDRPKRKNRCLSLAACSINLTSGSLAQ